MKRILPALTLALALAAVFCAASVFAANEVSVVLNGDSLNFTEAQPQIINDRTMVPIRETAEFLGMTAQWDEASRTMTLTSGDNRTIKHTLNQNTIIIDGATKTYDSPSAVVDNRSLMPVRMLADAIDAQVEWDAVRYRVNITKEMNPAVIMAKPLKTDVTAGESFVVQVMANTDTTTVKLTDSKQADLGSSSNYVESAGIHIFSVSMKAPSEGGSQIVMAFAGTDQGFNASPDKTFTLNVEVEEDEEEVYYDSVSGSTMFGSSSVTGSGGSVSVNSYTFSSTDVYSGDTVTATAYTGTAVTRMWVQDPNGDTLSSTSTYTENGSEYKWSLTFTAEISGYHYIYVRDSDGKEGYVRDYITVDGSSSSTSLAINDYTMSPSTIYDEDDRVTFTVYTSTAATKVWVEYPSGSTAASTSSRSSSGSEYVWTLNFYPDEEGSYYIYASDSSGNETYKRVSISYY